MLKRFEVENFRNFQENFVFDLSETKNYEFNPECVDNGIVSKGLIYGINGCGKSNLGWALSDIVNHLGDMPVFNEIYSNYLNGHATQDFAEFKYFFEFDAHQVEYIYRKKETGKTILEELKIGGNSIIKYEHGQPFTTTLIGAEGLRKDITGSQISSVIKYIARNSVLEENINSSLFYKFFNFASGIRISREVAKNPEVFTKAIIREKYLSGFQDFLNRAGIVCKLEADEDEKEEIYFIFNNKKIDFWGAASAGTKALARSYCQLQFLQEGRASFLYIDEFDAFYHHELSELIIQELKGLKSQIILTTHNTSLMSNDLLRPDCNFIMQNDTIKPLYQLTDKELRFAHNIEKMYRGGMFDV